jgi:hypothetical protein
MKGAEKGPNFFTEVFHLLCHLVKNLRIFRLADWQTLEIWGFADSA